MKLLLEKNRIICLLFCLLLFNACEKKVKKENIKVIETSRVAYLPYYNDESFTPHWLTPNSEEEKKFHKIPDFKLFNQLGDTVSQKTFENKIYVANFFFTTCPGICPKMTGNMERLQEEFINDSQVLLLSHSVTPTIDSIPVLKEYAKNNNVIDNKWHLVTGSKKTIYDLGRNQYFVENNLGEVRDVNDFLHTENFVLVDKKKHIRGIYNGLNRASVSQLITDIKALQKEK